MRDLEPYDFEYFPPKTCADFRALNTDILENPKFYKNVLSNEITGYYIRGELTEQNDDVEISGKVTKVEFSSYNKKPLLHIWVNSKENIYNEESINKEVKPKKTYVLSFDKVMEVIHSN